MNQHKTANTFKTVILRIFAIFGSGAPRDGDLRWHAGVCRHRALVRVGRVLHDGHDDCDRRLQGSAPAVVWRRSLHGGPDHQRPAEWVGAVVVLRCQVSMEAEHVGVVVP